MAKRAALVLLYLLLVAGALFAALRLERWFLKGVGWTILAVLAAVAFEVVGEGIFEIRKVFDYTRYREEWELANGSAPEAPGSPGDRGSEA